MTNREDEAMSEIDWTNNESVVRAVFPDASCHSRGSYHDGEKWLEVHPTKYDTGKSLRLQDSRLSSGCSSENEAWAVARRHPTVQAYERQHNPAYASPTPMCGQIYEGDAGARAGAVCVRPMGHASYHGTELDALTAGGGFYWHDRTPAEIAKDASPTQAPAEPICAECRHDEHEAECSEESCLCIQYPSLRGRKVLRGREIAKRRARAPIGPAPAASEEVVLPDLDITSQDRDAGVIGLYPPLHKLTAVRLHCRERQLLAALTDNRDLRARIALMRDAFEDYIRDRHHRVEMSDMEVVEVINEWQDIAQEVQDVE